MGAFVGEIAEKGMTGQEGLMGCSQSKLVEYYSSYKSICEGYTISIAEFTHIFGANQRSFAVWDTKSRGRVDAIELFSGLVVFSNIRYEQKVKFLFEIFDFNEQGVLGYENLALMLLNICNATYKLQGQNKMLSQASVQLFLDEYFTQQSRIQLSRLLRWTFRVPIIAQFFHAIGHDIQTPQQQRKIATYDLLSYQQRQKKIRGTYKAQRELSLDNKFITSLDSLVNRSKIEELQMLNLEISWVLGMEVQKQRVRYMRVEGQKAGNERILYAVGKMIVIYYPKLSLQHYYSHHIKPISVIELSTSKKLVASAERGDYPEVHVWDVKTRLTLLKFRRLHKFTIQLMSFIDGDRMLVTVSRYCIRNNTQCPVIVINLQTQEVIMSTYLRSQVLGIIPAIDINEKRLLSFNILSTHALTKFFPQYGSFSLSTERLTIENNLLAPVHCFLSMSQGLLLTSHIGRRLVVWHEKGRQVGYAVKGGEIIQMVELSNRLTQIKLLLLDESDAQIITLRTNDWQVIRSQLLQLRSGGLFNLRFSLVCPIDEDSILVASQFGDVVRVEGLRLSLNEPIRLCRYYQLFRLEQVFDCCFLNSESMLIFSGMFVYLIDRNQKQLKILSRLDFEIKQIDLYKEALVVLGGEAGKNIIGILNTSDFTVKESYKLAYQVEDFKLTQNYLVVLSEHALDIFHRVGDRFFEREPIHHKLTVSKPVSLVRTQQGRSVLLITQSKEIMKVNLGGSNLVEIAKIEKSNEPQLDKFIGIYPQGSFRYPLVVNSNRRLVAMGRKDGSVQLWESLIQSVGQNQSQTQLRLHDDRVNRLLLEDEQLVTVGCQDGLIVMYQHKKYLQKEEEEPFFQDQEQQQEKVHKVTRSHWTSRKEVLSVPQLLGNYLKESQLHLSTLSDSQNMDIKNIINDIVTPRNRLAYEPLIREQNNNYYQNLHIQTEAILGMNSKAPRSLFYLHSYLNQAKGMNLDANYWQPDQPPLPPSSEELQFAKRSLLPLDDEHTNCKREVLSFSDRFCILKETGSQRQRFYEYHRRKITCIAVHPSRQLVCSCQIGHRSPLIHIWEPQQLITKATVQTRHNSAITRVQFSRDGQWIVSLGGSDREQSIQISSWRHQQIIAFRFLEEEILKQVLFDPYNREELCVAGAGLIRVYNVKNSQLIIKEQCRPKEQQFQALTYTSSVFGSQIQSDVITGSSNGDIGLYICGKFIVSREKAHQGGVKCLRLAQLFRYKRVLLSGGGQGVIKIWDVKFNEISKKNLRQQLYSAKMTPLQVPSCDVTSLDVYQCLRQVGSEHPPTLLLIGTADGSVLEARIHNQFQGYQSYSIATAESTPVKQKINFDMTLLSTAPPTLITHFQLNLPLLATYSQTSPYLHIWAFASRTRLRAAPLPAPPAFVKFLNTRDRLLIGFKDRMIGALHFYQFTSGPTSVSELQLCGQIPLQKSSYLPQSAVFSQKDNRLAVGFRSIDGDEIGIYDREEGERQLWTMKVRVNESDGKIKRLFWMDFSSSSLALLVGWNLQSKLESNEENSNIYRCYSCSSQQILPSEGFDFQTLNFSPRILASYIPCLPLLDLVHKQSLLKQKLPITAMTQHERYLLLGTVNGEVLVVEGDFFAKKDCTQTRVWTHIIGDAPITSLATIDGLLLVSTAESEGITILKLSLERSWQPAQSEKDIYSQQLTQEVIETKRSVYMQRKKIEGEQENGGQWICQVELKLSAVIGRSSLYRRNNLFIDLKDNIISFSGCNLLIMHYIQDQRISQQILKPDPSPASIHPEISCLALGDCKRLLLVGTNEDDARLIAWDISTNTNLFQIRFPGFISVALAKLSPSNRHAALLAIAKTSQKYLIFVDLHNRKVLAVHRFPAILQINDLCFVVGKQFWLIACGGNYIAEWSYQNGQLSQRRYSLKAEQSEENKFGIVFYSIIFVSEWAISAGSDGYLYVWTDGSIVKRQNAHPKQAVLCLYTSSGSKIFVSGATDGRVIIWHFGSSLIIQKIQQFATYTGKDPRAPLKFQVQSICMTKQSLIVGNRAGQIIQFPFSSGQTQPQEASSQQPLTILSAFDHQKVNSCAFNISSRKLYLMTEAEAGFGTFAVFDVATLEKMRQQRVELKSGLVRMLACKLSSRIFVVMKNSIATYSYQAQVRDEKYNKFLRRKEWLKCESGIKAAVLNTSQTYLAVLIAPNSLENAKIQIYNLQVPEGQFYSVYKVEQNINANIELIDFSSDHDYLVFQSTDEQMTILDLLSKEKVKPGSIENQLQWNQDAKKISSTVRNIAAAYSEDNKLLKVVQVRNQCLIATDTMGSLRLFPYPLQAIKDHPSRAYVEHLNEVYICVLSPDSRTLVTVGREDRAIHFWEVFHKPSQSNSYV